jgi:hypothetical protein
MCVVMLIAAVLITSIVTIFVIALCQMAAKSGSWDHEQ